MSEREHRNTKRSYTKTFVHPAMIAIRPSDRKIRIKDHTYDASDLPPTFVNVGIRQVSAAPRSTPLMLKDYDHYPLGQLIRCVLLVILTQYLILREGFGQC